MNARFWSIGFAVALLVMLVAPADGAMLGLVANGDFEEPTGSPDFPPWEVWGGADPNLDTFVSDTNPHSPVAHATSGPFAPGGIYQDLATALGTQYVLSFWLFNAVDTPNVVSVSWEGVQLFSAVNLPQSTTYTQHSFNITANQLPDLVPGPVVANTSRLRFTFEHPQGWFDLDDVSVTVFDPNAVPEPASIALWSLSALGLGLAYKRLRRLAK